MPEDINKVIKDCSVVDGYISCTMDELETIYVLGYLSGKIVEREAILKELEAIRK